MKFLPYLVLFFVSVSLIPAYSQEFSNPTLVLQTIDVPAEAFNRVKADSVITKLDSPHEGSWQIVIQNDLVYANPKGNAIIRFYDANSEDKYIDIVMGSLPDRPFWAAFNLPYMGYVPATHVDKQGWSPDGKIILAYSDAQGISIGNGKRIVVSSVNLDGFVVDRYSVYGMEEATDPPAMNSGKLTIEVMSGDISKNPFHYYPFVVSGSVGAIILILLVIKKRS
ncbi:MAG: hypothetical protein LV468_00855 [Candidatus Nitrosotenuis sp.]|nr:hypothetical protein [Candidatus Nitrosotenuis sp.]